MKEKLFSLTNKPPFSLFLLFFHLDRMEEPRVLVAFLAGKADEAPPAQHPGSQLQAHIASGSLSCLNQANPITVGAEAALALSAQACIHVPS